MLFHGCYVVQLLYISIIWIKNAQTTLNFRKLQVALNLMYRILLNFAKSCVLSFLLKFDNINIIK